MVSAVHPALQDSEQRLRAGKATPTERNLLTRIAVPQDVRAQAEERATTKSDEPAPSVAADDASAIAARDPGLLEKTNAQITQAASTSQNGTSSAEIRTPSVRVAGAGTVAAPRIYIQIYEESKRAAAEKLRDWTQNTKNWLAPG